MSTAVEQAGTASTTTTPEHGSQAQYDTALQHNDTCTKAQLEHGAAWGSEEAGGFYVDLGPKYRAKQALSEDGRAEASPAARPNPTRTANVFVKLPGDYAEEEAQERARKHQQAQKQLPAHRPAQEQEQQQEQEHHEYQYQHQHQHQNQNQHHHHHHLQYQQTLFTGDPMDWDPIVEGATTPDEAREWPGPDEDHYAVDACGRCASWVEVTGQLAARMQEQDVSSRAQWERIWQLERLVWEQNSQLQEQRAALAAACQWIEWQQWMFGINTGP